MKKKTVVIIAIVMAAIVLALYVAVCCIYSLFDNENKTYFVGLIVFPLLPFILLFALLPNMNFKMRGPNDEKDPDNDK